MLPFNRKIRFGYTWGVGERFRSPKKCRSLEIPPNSDPIRGAVDRFKMATFKKRTSLKSVRKKLLFETSFVTLRPFYKFWGVGSLFLGSWDPGS